MVRLNGAEIFTRKTLYGIYISVWESFRGRSFSAFVWVFWPWRVDCSWSEELWRMPVTWWLMRDIWHCTWYFCCWLCPLLLWYSYKRKTQAITIYIGWSIFCVILLLPWFWHIFSLKMPRRKEQARICRSRGATGALWDLVGQIRVCTMDRRTSIFGGLMSFQYRRQRMQGPVTWRSIYTVRRMLTKGKLSMRSKWTSFRRWRMTQMSAPHAPKPSSRS